MVRPDVSLCGHMSPRGTPSAHSGLFRTLRAPTAFLTSAPRVEIRLRPASPPSTQLCCARKRRRVQGEQRPPHASDASPGGATQPSWVRAASPPPTPIAEIRFRRRRFFVKRDDTLSIAGLTGSKARKFRSLSRPAALDDVDVIASFGGVQSNAMRSLALFAELHHIPFVYYISRPVPSRLRRQPSGNLHDSLAAGMTLRQIPEHVYRTAFQKISPGPFHGRAGREPSAGPAGHAEETASDAQAWVCQDLRDEYPDPRRIMFIPQGGAWPPAEEGLRELADELLAQLDQLRNQGNLSFPRKVPVLFCGAGTGTTAFFLARHLQGKVRVLAVPVAGTAEYLIEQMLWLEESVRLATTSHVRGEEISATPERCTGALLSSSTMEDSLDAADAMRSPIVLRPRIRSTFADVREGKLLIFRELERAAVAATTLVGANHASHQGLHFDLIYGPNAWEEVVLALDEGRLEADRDYMFLHTGGTEANETMLDRFRFKNLLSEEDALAFNASSPNQSSSVDVFGERNVSG